MASQDIENLIPDFWYHAYLAAKKIRRGELLDGKSICDGYMKNCLVSMIKIQTIARKGTGFEVWHGYRFFEQWTDPNVAGAFSNLFARYEKEEVWEALHRTMLYFRDISTDVCNLLEIDYPDEAAAYATKLVHLLYDNRNAAN